MRSSIFGTPFPAALDSGIEEIDRPKDRRPKKRITAKDIPSIYPVGSDVIVQVTKGPIGTKGPRVSTNLSFAGRYLVFMPYSDRSGISRKIEDPKERERLRKILRDLEIPEGVGVIIRTVGEGQRARYFVRDLSFLLEQWAKVEQLIQTEPAPCRVFEEPDLVDRTVRDFLTDEIDEVVCDDRAAIDRMNEMVGQISRRARSRIQFYDGAAPIFETFGIQKQIDDAFHRQVWLKCGGYIVIDETEALVAIDVNTGPKQRRPRRREDDPANQSGSGRRNRAAIAPAQRRRPDHRRFHRHEEPERSADGLHLDEGAVEAGQSQNARPSALRPRPDGDDAAARAGKPERFDLRKLPLLPGPRRGEDVHDDERGAASHAEHRHAQISGQRARFPGDFESGRVEAIEGRGRRVSGRAGAALCGPA